MRATTIAAVISLACIAGSTELLAQSQQPSANCDLLNDPQLLTDVTACAKSLLNHQSLINTSNSIAGVIQSRFDPGPDQTEPAGLELSGAKDIAERLSGNGTILIAPTADVAAPMANPMWNIWIDGKYSWLDDTAAFTDLDGSLVNGIVGADTSSP